MARETVDDEPAAPATATEGDKPSARSNGTPQNDWWPYGSRPMPEAVASDHGEASVAECDRIAVMESGVDFDIRRVSFARDCRVPE